jgi:hypothetical protein
MSDAPREIQPNAPLSVTLPAARWNAVLMLLEAAVGGLIGEIQRQCMEASQPAAAERMPARRGNGAAEPRHEVDGP